MTFTMRDIRSARSNLREIRKEITRMGPMPSGYFKPVLA